MYGTTSGALKGPLNIRRLFRGIGAPLATTGVVQTLNFGIYDNVLRSLAHNNEVKLTDYFWAGSIGGACISFITTPVSLIKIQLQVSHSGSCVVWEPSRLHFVRWKCQFTWYADQWVVDVCR